MIDFYAGRSEAGTQDRPPIPSFHIDARPALDSWEAAAGRIRFAAEGYIERVRGHFFPRGQ